MDIALLNSPFFRFKDGHEISADARIKISRDSQRIENYYMTLNLARTEDAGTYEMKATNFIGETTSTCKVAVLSKYIALDFSLSWVLDKMSEGMERIILLIPTYQSLI